MWTSYWLVRQSQRKQGRQITKESAARQFARRPERGRENTLGRRAGIIPGAV
jgi:hypothetical protein